jgi:hypothetical protein
MKRILLFTAIAVLFVLPVFAQKTASLTNADKAQIIRAILLESEFAERPDLPDEQKLIVYLSTENISQNLVPGKVGAVKILLKSPQQIEKEKKNWLDYRAFGKFARKGSTVIVRFNSYTRVSQTGEFDLMVQEFEYRKKAGKWELVSIGFPGMKLGA